MILLLAGTSDARELAVKIRQRGYELLTTVVTENAAKSLQKVGLPVQIGRLTAEDIEDLVRVKNVAAIVDATHPYAEEASKNAIAGAQKANVPYIRYERESRLLYEKHDKIMVVEDYIRAAEAAAEKRGIILLTTGSKMLQIFTERLLGFPDITLIVRMLPRKDNMEKCERLGIEQKNIVAMQGPFSKELNKAIYDHYKVTMMITKESGKVGAIDEKVEAALEMGIDIVIIARPKLEYGTYYSDFDSVIKKLNELS
ncbi:precorrin-6A reductase [Microaerobacter geothermalis]|uniref:precorrin-6A reductase n=1 Tax=Microaerobacter geothermalis TaxID=674972 RepID=UPI001EFFB1BA|nr:precorrin-6A reductase [Microaerobacter geothermalis]MCF6095269.1 precorrin-6A reductase [Microaerobacter geothermalis]